MLPLLFCGLLAIGAVFGQEEIDYSGMTTMVQLENKVKWWPPPPPLGGGGLPVDSSEHGVKAGRRTTNCKCGWANKSGRRIIGGKAHGPNEYPFIVGVAPSSAPTRPFCGGTIVSPWHVITAAHCTATERNLVVTLGEYIRGAQRPLSIRVARIMDHERYNARLLHNDISMLFLSTPIQTTQQVGPACLPTGQENIQRVRIIGWGAGRFQGPMSSTPQFIDMTTQTHSQCLSAWPQNLDRQPSQICTYEQGKSACQGDSGGPVMWLDPDTLRYTIVGAVSFGAHCRTDTPSVQTSVVYHLPWIHQKIQATAPGQMTCNKV